MNYQIRTAEISDLPVIKSIYAYARQFMADHGNASQWGQSYPEASLLCQDIDRRKLFVIQNASGIHGVFYFSVEQDPTYAVIEQGTWRWDRPYGVIHRIAGDGSGGILRTAVDYASKQIGHLRIDTHADNYVMQKALEKLGFSRRGIIYIEDGTPRIAYDTFFCVREAERDDLQAVLQLYLHLHEDMIPEDSITLEDTWKRILEDRNHHLIVYELAGKIVSSCVCVVIPNLTRGVHPYALVENVVTHKDFRHHGYATACLKYAKEIAEASGCYKIMLLTGAKEEKTKSFYQNAGYNCTDKTAFVQWLKK